MTEWSLEAVRVAVTLLPGFLTVKVKNFFAPKLEVAAFDQMLEVGLRLTSRTGREDVWQDAFATFGGNWLVLPLLRVTVLGGSNLV